MLIKGNFTELKELLNEPKHILLITHRNADGDAVGSALGMSHYLSKKNHRVTVMTPDAFPDFLKWMPGADQIVQYDRYENKSKKIIARADIIFLMDFNELSRTGDRLSRVLKDYHGTFVMMDHHENPSDEADYLFSDSNICATAQMAYHFIDKMGELRFIDEAVATCFYAGILTDTGSFRFPKTDATTLRIAAHLVEAGADNARIYDRIFNVNSPGRLKLLGKALNNIQVLEEYKTAYMLITEEDKKEHSFRKGDTEGFVNYCLSIKGITFGVIFIEDKDQGIIKISFRSKGNFSVNHFARQHFNGGGHLNAAGGRSDENLRDTLTKFTSLLEQYKEELLHSYEE